jgi:hypothetical protein
MENPHDLGEATLAANIAGSAHPCAVVTDRRGRRLSSSFVCCGPHIDVWASA